MAEVEPKKKTAPYLPFKTFLNSLDVFSQGLPTTLDRTIWRSQSNVMQGLIMNTYRFLGMVDEYDAPTAALSNIVRHQEQRPTILRGLIEATYGDQFGRDFSALTPKVLEDMFEDCYAVTGATKQKAITFFLKAAKFSNITLSPFLLNQIRNTVSRKKRIAKTRDNGAAAVKEMPTNQSNENQPAADNAHVVGLASGGTVTITITANPFKMSVLDREFVFGLIDQLQKYEAANPVENDEVEDEDDE